VLISGAVYSCLYLYEWLTWSNKAKEREFKSQYVNHASKKLKMIVDLTSSNCSHQVEQELSSTFARLCQLVDRATDDMHEGIKQLDTNLKQVEDASNSAKVLRNKAHYLIKELDMFQEAYLVNMN
ncbi:hypothetical protein WDU94_004621, partial [Cyamophila willieti]